MPAKKQLWLPLGVIVVVFLYAIVSYLISFSLLATMTPHFAEPVNITTSQKPLILMWSKYYQVRDYKVEKLAVSGRTIDETCCQGVTVTLNRSRLEEADVVVFFSYPGNMKKSDIPTRLPHQVWVLYAKESPAHSSNHAPFNNLINWTMTYRKDSDIWNPYGYYTPTKSSENIIRLPDGTILSNWIANKSKMLSAVISHCPTVSKRERLILSMREAGLSVGVYGACGEHKICPRSNHACDHDGFWRNLSSAYRFYFAAENALCEDYITEKFWRPLSLGMVPVVYGGATYQDIAPPNSYIDVRDFPTLRNLTRHLQWLSDTPEEYAKYFEWRKDYDVVITDAWHGWCQLCKLTKLYTANKEIFVKKT